MNKFKVQSSKFKNQSGQAVLIAVLFLVLLSAGVTASFVPPVVREVQTEREQRLSMHTYYAAESGTEDAVYRLRSGASYLPSYEVATAHATTTVVISENGNQRNVIATGDAYSRRRAVETNLVLNVSEVQFFYGVQVGDGGLSMSNNAIVNGNVYSNGNITGSNGARVMGAAIVAGGINTDPHVTWEVETADQFFATASTNRDIAQSFTASSTDSLPRLAVYLGKVGNPSAAITVRIANDNNGKPSTSSLASAAIPAASVGVTASWINVAFSSPANLSAGNKYWIVLDTGSNSGSNYWNWRKDSSNAYAGNTGRYTSNWSSGGATWTEVGGDLAFRVWQGGVSTKIANLTVGNSESGLGRANLFENVTIHGAACPNQYCLVENPPREELPISEGVIEDWRQVAAAGGTCVEPLCDASGNFSLSNGATGSLGPIKIPGNLTLANNAKLTVTGTIWVGGNIVLSNGDPNSYCMRLDPAYGANSGVVLTDGNVTVSNNCIFQGSGDEGSYVLLLSAREAPSTNVMSISNNSVGVIYYATAGRIHFSNNAGAKEATGYGISMDNNAVITYESGLSNVFFSSGPGASFDISKWREI